MIVILIESICKRSRWEACQQPLRRNNVLIPMLSTRLRVTKWVLTLLALILIVTIVYSSHRAVTRTSNDFRHECSLMLGRLEFAWRIGDWDPAAEKYPPFAGWTGLITTGPGPEFTASVYHPLRHQTVGRRRRSPQTPGVCYRQAPGRQNSPTTLSSCQLEPGY